LLRKSRSKKSFRKKVMAPVFLSFKVKIAEIIGAE